MPIIKIITFIFFFTVLKKHRICTAGFHIKLVFDQFIAVGEIPEIYINFPANCFLQPVQ